MRKGIREAEAGGSAETADAGPKLAAAADVAEDVGAPADVGQWETTKTPFPIVAIHAAQLPTGKIMFFSYPTYPNRPNNAEAYLWDPADPEVAARPEEPARQGQHLVRRPDLHRRRGAGGVRRQPGLRVAPRRRGRASTGSSRSTPGPRPGTSSRDMVHGRWYPTGVRLPDGRVPIMSGLDESGQLIPHSNTVQDVELFTPSADARWGGHDQDHRVDRHRPRRRAREEAARQPLPAHVRDG